MTITKNISYNFTEEEQRALVVVHGILLKLCETENYSEDPESCFNAFCVVDSLCEDIPSYIWNPDEKTEDDEE